MLKVPGNIRYEKQPPRRPKRLKMWQAEEEFKDKGVVIEATDTIMSVRWLYKNGYYIVKE